MIDVIFNAVKFVVSPEFRSSAASIVEHLRKTPEWEKDFCTLDITIPRRSAEQAVFFRDLAAVKLAALTFRPPTVTAFKTSFTELVGNAFEHGCRGLWPRVNIVIEITVSFAALAVYNSRWRRLDLQRQLERARARLDADPGARRGQGLVLVSKLADELRQDGPRGVKAVFYPAPVEFNVRTFGDLAVIKLNNAESLDNPAAGRRLLDLASNYLTHHIILNFNVVVDPSGGSKLREAFLELKDLTALSAKSLVVYMPNNLGIRVPDAMAAFTWENALRKATRPDLVGRVQESDV
jgi:anti-sigma regulatory factor (Ser/Thr protein kinase)